MVSEGSALSLAATGGGTTAGDGVGRINGGGMVALRGEGINGVSGGGSESGSETGAGVAVSSACWLASMVPGTRVVDLLFTIFGLAAMGGGAAVGGGLERVNGGGREGGGAAGGADDGGSTVAAVEPSLGWGLLLFLSFGLAATGGGAMVGGGEEGVMGGGKEGGSVEGGRETGSGSSSSSFSLLLSSMGDSSGLASAAARSEVVAAEGSVLEGSQGVSPRGESRTTELRPPMIMPDPGRLCLRCPVVNELVDGDIPAPAEVEVWLEILSSLDSAGLDASSIATAARFFLRGVCIGFLPGIAGLAGLVFDVDELSCDGSTV